MWNIVTLLVSDAYAFMVSHSKLNEEYLDEGLDKKMTVFADTDNTLRIYAF